MGYFKFSNHSNSIAVILQLTFLALFIKRCFKRRSKKVKRLVLELILKDGVRFNKMVHG